MLRYCFLSWVFFLAALVPAPSFADDLKSKAKSGNTTPPVPAYDDDELVDVRKIAKFNWNVFSKSQGAGTPNQAGGQVLIPLFATKKSVFFVDVLAAADFGDLMSTSSIVHTPVAGTTLSTSSRLGYRFLNNTGDILFGINAGYDSRPISTGIPSRYSRIPNSILQPQDVFFQQVALGAELVTKDLSLKPYALIPIGTTEDVLNFFYSGGALDTYGVDIEYEFNTLFSASIGYYYQQGDLTLANGSGLKSIVSINPPGPFSFGVEYSYDPAFEGRLLGFVSAGTAQDSHALHTVERSIQIAVNDFVDNRSVRVHDCHHWDAWLCKVAGIDPIDSGIHSGTEWVKMVGYEIAAFKCASDGNWHCAYQLLDEAGLKNQWLKNYQRFTGLPLVGPIGQFCGSDPDTCIELLHTTFDVALESWE